MTQQPGLLNRISRALAVGSALLCAFAAQADGLNTFWEVTGRHNTLWLFGSVHVLHSSDTALPKVATDAYGEAEMWWRS